MFTFLGAAFFAGIKVGFWKDKSELKALVGTGKEFKPEISENERRERTAKFDKATSKAMDWTTEQKGRRKEYLLLFAFAVVVLGVVTTFVRRLFM